ncbi:MAG TPA: hypothetical protein ENJ64_01475 [Thiotrichales bacterium]|nr:hypothetical protein [Thiotrichales bacterium]
MDYSFNPKTFRDLFHAAIDEHLADVESVSDDTHSPLTLADAMDQAIDVMARAEADEAVRSSMSAESMGVLEEKDITEIGRYALELLEGLVAFVEEKSGQQSRELMRLSIPLSLWVARHGGRLQRIDMVVNSLAGYANEITEPVQLADLAGIIGEIIEACSDEIKQDMEQTNLMRPWRILNLNYGIVATRSHDPALIEKAYDSLVKNLPQDARGFFREGMAQMDIIGYPQAVREVVERYDKMWGSENVLH